MPAPRRRMARRMLILTAGVTHGAHTDRAAQFHGVGVVRRMAVHNRISTFDVLEGPPCDCAVAVLPGRDIQRLDALRQFARTAARKPASPVTIPAADVAHASFAQVEHMTNAPSPAVQAVTGPFVDDQ